MSKGYERHQIKKNQICNACVPSTHPQGIELASPNLQRAPSFLLILCAGHIMLFFLTLPLLWLHRYVFKVLSKVVLLKICGSEEEKGRKKYGRERDDQLFKCGDKYNFVRNKDLIFLMIKMRKTRNNWKVIMMINRVMHIQLMANNRITINNKHFTT